MRDANDRGAGERPGSLRSPSSRGRSLRRFRLERRAPDWRKPPDRNLFHASSIRARWPAAAAKRRSGVSNSASRASARATDAITEGQIVSQLPGARQKAVRIAARRPVLQIRERCEAGLGVGSASNALPPWGMGLGALSRRDEGGPSAFTDIALGMYSTIAVKRRNEGQWPLPSSPPPVSRSPRSCSGLRRRPFFGRPDPARFKSRCGPAPRPIRCASTAPNSRRAIQRH